MNEDFASRAKVLITQRRYEDAVRLCRRGLSTDAFREEGRDEGHRVLGIALLALRRLDEVRTEMTVLLQSHPTDVVARRLLGQAFMMSGDVARARDELEEARRIAPDDARITAVLARLAQATDESDPPTDVSVPPPMRPGGPPEAAMIGAIPAGAASTSTAVTPVIPAVARAAARRMAAARTGATSRPPSEPPPLPPSSARVIRSFAPQGPADRSSPPPPRPPSSRPPPPPPPSMAASTIDSLDEPLSTRDVVPTRSPAEPARQSSRPPPVKPTIGPAPPMAVPRDLLRQVPVLPAPEPPTAPARRSSVPPRGTIPPAAVIEAGPPATPAVPSPLRRLMPWAALAAVAILVLVGLLRWRAEARREQELEAAERNEALGDDPSLRSAIREYRALADDAPTRENIARLARAHGLRALELGARDDAREGRELLELLRRSGDASEVSAPIEAAARAYLLAADGKLDEAESTLRPRRARDPHLAFLRARIALLSEAHEEALRMLRASAAAAPAWVRQSCALVEAMFARDPTDASWRQQLDVLAASHDRHFGIRLLRARLYAARPDMHAAARRELQSLAQPALWDAAGPSERAWVHLLDALLSLERPDGRDEVVRALAAAREVPAIHDVPYRLLLSRVLIELGQAAQAKSELVDLAQTAPPRARADARLLLAEAHLGLGELAEAEALLTGADDSARRHLLHGRVLMAQRKTAEALAEFRVAKTRDPSLALVVDLEGARAQLDIRETSPALQTLRALVREHPEDLSVALLLGDALLQAGDFAEAEAAYRRALRLAPDLVDARMRLATLARGRGDIAGARSMVEQISARDPGNLAAQVLAASIAGEAGDLAEAHRILSRLEGLPAAPDEAGAITILRAELSLREGTFEGVPALLERGQRAGAPEGEHQHVLGLFKLRTYRIPDALSALRRATDAASGAGVRRAELARAYQLATVPGRDAEQNAEDALRIDPDLADALAVRALVVMDSPNLGAAAPLLRQAQQSLAERPRDTNVQAYVTMARGRYDYEQGRPRDARTLLEEAIRLDGKLAEAHYFLGLAQIDLTNRAEACTELARFLELAPDVRDSADARSQRTRMGCR